MLNGYELLVEIDEAERTILRLASGNIERNVYSVGAGSRQAIVTMPSVPAASHSEAASSDLVVPVI